LHTYDLHFHDLRGTAATKLFMANLTVREIEQILAWGEDRVERLLDRYETQPGKTATFPAGQLIPGWVEALQKMKEGDEWELVIPSNLGYGEAGAGGVIPPNQTLIFDMTLLKVEPPSGQPGGQ
jgi:hypothetical protein